MTEYYASKEFIEKWNKLWREAFNRYLIGDNPKETTESRVKLAWVTIEGKRAMLGVDNETFEGYRMDDKYPTVKKPLEKQQYDSFVRWCTSMDL